MNNSNCFEVLHKDKHTSARLGKLKTYHGDITTPVFMPVGTQASVKTLSPQDLKDNDVEIILGNTYHLYLRPGHGIIKELGGLHRFIGWDRPILTDSGGFQVFSHSDLRKINEDGVEFRSYIDGSKHFMTPELSIEIQESLGADIIMIFDEPVPYPSTYEYTLKSTELTTKWAGRCKERHNKEGQLLFGIVQGGIYEDLRKNSIEDIVNIGFDGYAIGGLSVGEEKEQMYKMTDYTAPLLPSDKPRYLMGVGTPDDIIKCVSMGVDMFDCVMPTRNGRNAMLFTTKGVLNIDNKKWEFDFSSIDNGLDCEVSNYYSKAYLRHLMKAKEFLGLTIASIHNLAFYLWLMKEARIHIEQGDFANWKTGMIEILRTKL